MGARLARGRGWLESSWSARAAGALALLLLLPSLGFGLRLDDRWIRVFVLGGDDLMGRPAPAYRLFSFFETPERMETLRRFGVAPWFGDPEVKLTFFRPVASALHTLEFRLLGEHHAAMHAISLAWFVALLAVAGRLYQRLLGRPDEGRFVVGLASVCFALDPSRGLAAGWLAQRNSLLAATFSGLTILAHDHARRGGPAWARWAAPGLLLLALGSAEAGTATLGVLAAHALCLEPRGQRLRALLPYAPPFLLWTALYRAGGYGARGSGMYLDPIHHPVSALSAALAHLPSLLAVELGFPLAEFWPFAPAQMRAMIVAVSLVLIAGLALGMRPRLARDPIARFFALASVLSVLPACAVAPSSRLLALASFWHIGLLAMAARDVMDDPAPLAPLLRSWHRGVVAWACFAHLVLAPPLLASASRQMLDLERALTYFVRGFPDAATERVVVLNSPDMTFLGYGRFLAPLLGKPTPRALLSLANGNRTVEVRGVDDHTVEVQSEDGFVSSTTDSLVRAAEKPMPVGSSFDLDDVRVEIVRVNEQGRADVARFRFARRLDDAALAWRAWENAGLVPASPPRPGEVLHFAPRSFLDVVMRSAQGKLPPAGG